MDRTWACDCQSLAAAIGCMALPRPKEGLRCVAIKLRRGISEPQGCQARLCYEVCSERSVDCHQIARGYFRALRLSGSTCALRAGLTLQ